MHATYPHKKIEKYIIFKKINTSSYFSEWPLGFFQEKIMHLPNLICKDKVNTISLNASDSHQTRMCRHINPTQGSNWDILVNLEPKAWTIMFLHFALVTVKPRNSEVPVFAIINNRASFWFVMNLWKMTNIFNCHDSKVWLIIFFPKNNTLLHYTAWLGKSWQPEYNYLLHVHMDDL